MKKFLLLGCICISLNIYAQSDQIRSYSNEVLINGMQVYVFLNLHLPKDSNQIYKMEFSYQTENTKFECPDNSIWCKVVESKAYFSKKSAFKIDDSPEAFISEDSVKVLNMNYFKCKPDVKEITFYRVIQKGSTDEENFGDAEPQDFILEGGSQNSVDQIMVENNEPIQDFVEIEAEFPGGEDSLKAFIAKNKVHPESAKDVYGSVYVQFVINIDGSISQINILKSPHVALSNEVIRIVKLMPKWKPGENAGKQTASRYTLRVEFPVP